MATQRLLALMGAVGEQESSEYETDSEDEAQGRQLLKPQFVPAKEREVCSFGTGSSRCSMRVRLLIHSTMCSDSQGCMRRPLQSGSG